MQMFYRWFIIVLIYFISVNVVWAEELEIPLNQGDFEREEDIAYLLEYGEYLSYECNTCHKTDGNYWGIPILRGYEREMLVKIMNEYALGERDNQAMQNVAKNLDQEMIQALAIYFSQFQYDD